MRIANRIIHQVARRALGDVRAAQARFILNNFAGLPAGFMANYRKHWKYTQAQHCQDIVALNFLDASRPGYFVEIGVGNGVSISNTYMFEKELGWQGLLCEPNPGSTQSIMAARSAPLDVRAAFSQSDLIVDFICARNAHLSTIAAFADSDCHDRSKGETVQVRTVSTADLFDQHNVPGHVDFLSIDTEGSELEILHSLPFNRHSFGFTCIEHNYRPDAVLIDDFMASHGYRKVLPHISAHDSWYVPNHN